jgi:hypothetical protein
MDDSREDRTVAAQPDATSLPLTPVGIGFVRSGMLDDDR